MTPCSLIAAPAPSRLRIRRIAAYGAVALCATLSRVSLAAASPVVALPVVATSAVASPAVALPVVASSAVATPAAALLGVASLVVASPEVNAAREMTPVRDARSSAMRRHLKLVKSSPAADSVLATAPAAIRLWLSEPAEVPATTIALTTAAGVAIKTNAVTRAATKDAPLEATIAAPLANGAYKVTWKTMSKDGHVVKGTFAFTVGAK